MSTRHDPLCRMRYYVEFTRPEQCRDCTLIAEARASERRAISDAKAGRP